eukprot:g3149.t1
MAETLPSVESLEDPEQGIGVTPEVSDDFKKKKNTNHFRTMVKADETPVRKFWGMDLGGPGWFEDVFHIQVRLTTDRRVRGEALSNIDMEEINVFRGDEDISGYVYVTGPKNWDVGHNGVSIFLEQSITFYDSGRTVDLPVIEKQIAEPGYIKDQKIFPFHLELSRQKKKFDSYDGITFCLRHNLVVYVTRPWYSTDVQYVEPLLVHNLRGRPGREKVKHKMVLEDEKKNEPEPLALENIDLEDGIEEKEKIAEEKEEKEGNVADTVQPLQIIKDVLGDGDETLFGTRPVPQHMLDEIEDMATGGKRIRNSSATSSKGVKASDTTVSIFAGPGIVEEDSDHDSEEEYDDDVKTNEKNKKVEVEHLCDVVAGAATFQVTDVGGTIKLTMPRCHYDLDERLPWEVTFEQLDKKLVKGALIFIRIEEGDADLDETNLYDLTIFDQNDPVLSKKEEQRKRIIKGEVELAELQELTPTYVDVNGKPEEDGITVRYFLRLMLLSEAGKAYWNTTEVIFYRKDLSYLENTNAEGQV